MAELSWFSWDGADMGFVGLNPSDVGVLADTVDQYAIRISLARRNTSDVLRRHSPASSFAGTLTHIESRLGDHSENLRWRARLVEMTQSVEVEGASGPAPSLAWFAATAVFPTDGWASVFRDWRLQQIPRWLPTASPRDVAELFAGMSQREVDAVVSLHPGLIGRLDGAPPSARYDANTILIAQEIDVLRKYRERFETYNYQRVDSRVLAVLVEHLDDRIDEYQRWLDEGRQILLFDPNGDGRVVEVFGDLAGAERIAVSVPGMANDITNFSTEDGGFRTNAGDLFAEIGRSDVATIAWLGYNTPDHVGAAVRTAASEGAPALQSFLEGIDPYSLRDVTVIAHSYGSVLAGTAASTGIEADNLVFVGSPGTTLDHAGDALLRSDGTVWAALADNDIIAQAISPSELPPAWLPPTLWPVWVGFDRWNDGAEELWHGTNPASDGFGAVEFTTDGCSGHSEYYEAGSLDNLAKIVAGLYSDVELVDPPFSGGGGSW